MKKLIFMLVLITTFLGCNDDKSKIDTVSNPQTSAFLSEKITQTLTPTATPVKTLEIKQEALDKSEVAKNLFNNGKYDEAAKIYDEALKIDSNCYIAYNGKGFCYGFKHKYDEAHKLIDNSLSINPKYGYGKYTKAFVYKLAGDMDKALEWFLKSLEDDEKNEWTYFGISTIYADRKDTINACRYLKKAIDINPDTKNEAKTQSHFNGIRNTSEFKALVN